LGRRLRWPDDYFTLVNSLQVQNYTLRNYPIISIGDKTFSNGVSTAIAFNTTLARNSVNNPTFPTNGSTISLSVSLTPPFSAFRPSNKFDNLADRFRLIEYHKWMFDASWFTPLAKNLVLNTRAHMGFLGAYNNDLGVGPFERFRLGGSGLSGFNFILGYDVIGLRGYQDSRVITGGNLGNNDASIIFNKYVTELRYAISTNPAATIYALGFFEAGNGWANYRDFNAFKVYRSYGVGARIFMPAFGMIGLDMGFPLDDAPTYNSNRAPEFHFTIGQQIR
jgi:outer membrane protein insertion porin family